MRLATLALLLVLTGCASTGLGSTGTATTEGLDDPLETIVTVHTMDYARPLVLAGGSINPAFRALIPKSAEAAAQLDSLGVLPGGAAYQLYAVTNSPDWMRWDALRFLAPGASTPTVVEADVIGTDVSCSRYGCAHYETVVARLTRAQLEMVRDAASPVTFRLDSGRSTANKDFVPDPAEIAALLAAVDDAQSALAN